MSTALFAVAIYAIAFIGLTRRWPAVGLSATIGSAHFAFDLGIGPVNVALPELNATLLFLGVVTGSFNNYQAWSLGPLGIPVFTYIAVCVVSSIHELNNIAIVAIAQIAVYLIVAVIGMAPFASRGDSVRTALLVFVLSGLLKAFIVLGDVRLIPQFVQHKNANGASLGAALVVAVELWLTAVPRSRSRTFIAITIAGLTIGLLSTLSRGGWMSALVGILILIGVRKQFQVVLRVGVLLIPVVALSWYYLPEDSRAFATGFESSRENIRARIHFLNSAHVSFLQNPVLGVGVSLRKEADATNVLLATLAETGVLGLTAFASLHGAVLMMGLKSLKRVSEVDPRRHMIYLALALLFGRLAHGMVDHYWSRGTLVVAWSMVGLALGVWRTCGVESAQWRVARRARMGSLRRSVRL